MTSKNWLQAIEDDEYELLIKLINNENSLAVADQTKNDKNCIRKYQRWIQAGKELRVAPSGTVIYVDGRRLLRKGEVEDAVKKIDKATKFSGSRKAVSGLKESVAGCSERTIIK